MEVIKLLNEKKDCCFCQACINVCPTNAIEIQYDEYGFEYPHINKDKCISCQQCINTCHYQKEDKQISLKETYAASSFDINLLQSASGGIFSSIAQAIVHQGGLVYGSAMVYENNQLNVKHICVDNLNDLNKIKGSKYVQSNIGYVYKDIKNVLKQGRIVLFSGTPCQVDGLYGYLKSKYDNLFTIDIICHGVPSQQFFQSYIQYIETKKNKKIIDYKFRDKNQGWKLYGKITYLDNQSSCEYFEPEESSYYQMFLNSYTYRENCYSCPYASDKRPGDITIGDYWCIDLVHPEYLLENNGLLDEKKGISTLIVNNKHGKCLIENYGKGLTKYPSTYEYAYQYNKQLIQPSMLKEERKIVLDMYKSQGYTKVEQWYQKRLSRYKRKRKLISMIPKDIKTFIKKILGRKV